MDIVSLALSYFSSYPIPVIMIVAIIIGTEPLLFLTFLAGAEGESVSFWTIFLFSMLSLIIADAAYYLIGKSDFIKRITPKVLKRKKYSLILGKIKEHTHDNLFVMLLVSKFVYGFRHAMNLYFGYHNIPYKEYLKRDFFALLFFFSLMLPLAWFAGVTAGASFESVKKVEGIIALALLFLLIVFIMGKIIFKALMKKYKLI